MAMSSVLEALIAIQSELKAPKDQSAGRYRYRNIEDINSSVKPLAAARGCAVVYTDTFTDGACVSTCKLMGSDGEISADGVAYVDRSPKHMSIEQASGAASSYARKYAACGLFAIDSSENDPDRTNAQPKRQGRFTKLSALKAEALGMGIPEELMKHWMDANVLHGKGLIEATDAEIAAIEQYISELINHGNE